MSTETNSFSKILKQSFSYQLVDESFPLLLKKYYVRKVLNRRKMLQEIDGKSYLKQKPQLNLKPHPFIRDSYWENLVKSQTYKTNKDALTEIRKLRGEDSSKVYWLFDPVFYRTKYMQDEDLKINEFEHFLAHGVLDGFKSNPFIKDTKLWKNALTKIYLNEKNELSINEITITESDLIGFKFSLSFKGLLSELNILATLDDYLLSSSYKKWSSYIYIGQGARLNVYRDLNFDLKDLSDSELYQHYVTFKEAEKRISCFEELLNQKGVAFNALNFSFDIDTYRKSAPDASDVNSDIGMVAHFIRIGYRESRLEGFKSLVGKNQIKKQFVAKNFRNKSRVLIFFHVYYQELVEDFEQIFTAYKSLNPEIIVGFVDQLPTKNSREFFKKYNAKLMLINNLGRDIGGYWQLRNTLEINDDDIVLLMHTKKSPHVSPEFRRAWLDDLLNTIGTSSSEAASRINNFQINKNLLMIGCRQRIQIGAGERNLKMTQEFVGRFGINFSNNFAYSSGTMGLYRGSLVNKVLNKITKSDLDPPKPNDLQYNIDGQFVHAVERSLAIVATNSGEILWL